jgi:hypothetical protein
VGTQLYYLEGSDANGMFTPSVSNATAFFGNNVDASKGGRPISVIELNRTNTPNATKVDRNVLIVTFEAADCYRIYDLDTMQTDRVADAIFSRTLRNDAGTATDAAPFASTNFPWGNFPAFAFLPTPDGKTIITSGGGTNSTAAGQAAGETAISIWDTSTNDAFTVLTDVVAVTRTASTPFPATGSAGQVLNPNCITRIGNQGEYWFLLNAPSPGASDNTERTAITLVRTRLTIPANLAAAAPGSIQVQVLGIQDLKATASDILFPAGTAGIVSIAAGRSLTAGGPPVLSTTDYNGNVSTLIPIP